MNNRYFFTVNLLIRSEAHLQSAVHSIMEDEKFFLENVQIVLIDSIGNPESSSFCADLTARYPENVSFVETIGQNPPESYNTAKTISAGTYVSFIDNFSFYSSGTLKKIKRILSSGMIPLLSVAVPESLREPGLLPPLKGIVEPGKNPQWLQPLLGAYFFLNKYVRSCSFPTKNRFHWDSEYLLSVLQECRSFVYEDEVSFSTLSPTPAQPDRFEPRYSSAFYTEAVRQYLLPILKRSPSLPEIQAEVLRLILIKFLFGTEEYYQGIPSGSRVQDFTDAVGEAFEWIPDSLILHKPLYERMGLDPALSVQLVRYKYRDEKLKPSVLLVPPRETLSFTASVFPETQRKMQLSGQFLTHIHSVPVTDSKALTAEILCINYEADGLYIDAVLSDGSYWEDSEYSLEVVVNGKRFPVVRSGSYSSRTVFDVPFVRRFAFGFFVPVSSGKVMDTAYINFKYQKFAFRIGLRFPFPASRLSDELSNSFYAFKDRIVTYDAKTRSLVIRRCTPGLLSLSETRLLNETGGRFGVKDSLYYRQIRHAAAAFKRSAGTRQIFVFYDEAGINTSGNLLFRYFSKHLRSHFETCMIVRKNSPEQVFLTDNGYENVWEKGSVRAMAAALSADIIFASDQDPYASIGFTPKDCICLRDKLNAQIFYVPNTFFTYRNAPADHRTKNNIHALFCTAEREKKVLLDPAYDYFDQMIFLTGHPLLDTVSDNREKIILIAPGHRRIFSAYVYSSYYRFSESSFFKAYNDLLTNVPLLSKCRKNHWKIAVLLPEIIGRFSGLFHSDDVVQFYPMDEHNATALTSRASVLITDYSDLQFRFAYVQKPVAYFFPPGLPIHSEHKGERIGNSGFGPVFTEPERLSDYLQNGAENGFSMEEPYLTRQSRFFSQPDKGNCRRIFEKVMEITSPEE